MRKTIQEIERENDQRSHIFGGCRSKMIKTDTAGSQSSEGNIISWGREDCIRWVEWRIRELTIENGEYIDDRGKWRLDDKAAGGRKLSPGDRVADYAVWLMKVRDNLSWHQIAYRSFPTATEDHIEKYESTVRRIYERVERNHPGSKTYKPPRLSERDKLLLEAVMLGVIPVSVSATPTTPTGREISKEFLPTAHE